MNDKILKEVRFLKIYAVALTVALVALGLSAFTQADQKKKFGEIDVQRINIVDEQGKRCLVISNPSKFPDPVINGHEYKGVRSIQPAGLIFYDTKGNEVGGIATTTTSTRKLSLIAFDYSTAEAIGFNRIEDNDGKSYSAKFEILDPPPAGTKLAEAASKQQSRVIIQNENKDAQITLADPEGKGRIKLLVDHDGNASIQVLDKNGKVVFTAPRKE